MAGERIEKVVENLGNALAATLGLELVEVEYRKEGPDWVLRCFIDKPDGVGIEDCQRFSEAFGPILDQEDPIPGSYLLEVSSPGLERPLKKDHDFERFRGNMVEIKTHQALNGHKIYRGELVELRRAAPENLIVIKSDGNIVEIPQKMVAKAHLVSELFSPKGGNKRQ